MKVAIAKPYIGDEEKEAALEVLSSGELVQGRHVAEFEQEFAEHHGVAYGVATSNGTTALTAALMAHEVGPGDEVIIPAFTFFATASAVLSVGAKPVFADIEPDTFNLDPAAVEHKITGNTRAIMPVHLYGHPASMPKLAALAECHEVALLEDSAQAHTARVGGQCVGAWGTACFSFHPSKNMTTTEGGMVLTNDSSIAEQLRLIRNQGMIRRYCHERLGYNYRMTNVAAAIGLVQLGRLDAWTERRIQNAGRLSQGLLNVRPPAVRLGHRHVYHQYTVRVPRGVQRDALVQKLNDAGVGARVYYPTPLYRQPVFQELGYGQECLPETEKATEEVLSLPVHPQLTETELQFVIDKTNALLRQL